MTSRVLTALLALSTGCGSVLGTMKRTSGTDYALSRPQEQDARIACSGHPCDAVQLERPYWDRYSKPWFVGGAAVDLALAGGGVFAVSKSVNPGSIILLSIGALFVATDAYFLASGAFTRHHGPWALTAPVTVDWQGARSELSARDLVGDDSVPSTFSIASLRNKSDGRP